MKRKPVIVMLGGGSYGWSPMLLNDFLHVPALAEAEIRICDLDLQAGELIAKLCRKMVRQAGQSIELTVTDNQREAFQGADFVIVTIATGGLECFDSDVRIPEKYGIFHTVGDSVGPGGWSRSIRNIPVFRQLALDLRKIAPRAVVLNYSNPLASLTAALAQSAPMRSAGLCHGLFEVYALLEHVFNLQGEKELSLRAAGVNHFFWVLDFTVRGEPGYPLLWERLKKKSLPRLVGAGYAYNIYQDQRGGNGKVSPKDSPASEYFVADELLREYGLLPYIGDRHTSEFMPRYLVLSPSRLKPYRLKRTMIADRRRSREKARKRVEAMVAGELPLPAERSREAAADIMSAMITNKDYIDVVNLPNVGQVDNLPRGAVVETLGVANAMGFAPLAAGSLPEPILDLVRPHAVNQQMIVEAALTGNRELALAALRNEPLCSHLSYPQVRKMGLELLQASEKRGIELPL